MKPIHCFQWNNQYRMILRGYHHSSNHPVSLLHRVISETWTNFPAGNLKSIAGETRLLLHIHLQLTYNYYVVALLGVTHTVITLHF